MNPDAQLPVEPEFTSITRSSYGASAQGVDFAHASEPARVAINGWVAAQTHDAVKDLLPPGSITTDTRMALTNAVYFKGAWRSPFDRKETAPAPFYTSPTASRVASLMHRTTSVRHGDIAGAQVFELAYARPNDEPGARMIVILPTDRGGLPAIEEAAARQGFAPFIGALGATTSADVWLPKFKLTLSFELGAPLTAMGMRRAFTDAADFSGLSKATGLRISRAIHKAFVDVDEQGTEAAAATAVIMAPTGVARHPTFRADHPFLFLIEDEPTGAILFVGRVVDPA